MEDGEPVAMAPQAQSLTLPATRVCATLAIAAVALVAANAATHLVAHASGHDHIYGLVPLLDLDRESNLPSFFSALLLVAAALLLALLSRCDLGAQPRDRRTWALLALVVLAMAVDEAASLHELLIRPMREVLGPRAHGVLHFSWVVPGAALVVVLAWSMRGFLLRLPAPTRRRVLLAGALYLGGALGMELAGGRHVAAHGSGDLFYRIVLVGLEEGLEMAGIIVLVRALMLQLAEAPSLRLVFVAPAARTALRQTDARRAQTLYPEWIATMPADRLR